MPLKAKLLVLLVVAAACTSVLAAFTMEPSSSIELLKLALGLGCFAVVAEYLVYKMPNGGSGSVALIPFMAIALVAPSWHGIVIVGASEALVQLAHRRAAVKLLYNTAQAIVAIAIAVLMYRIAGGTSFAVQHTFAGLVATNAMPAFVCLIAFAVVNSVAVAGIIAFSQGSSFAEVWTRNTLGTIVYYLLAWPFACGLAWVYTHVSPVAAIALAIPMLGVRQLYKTTLQLQQTNRELLELMVKAIETRDPYTSGHSRRVSKSATVIARGLGLTAAQVERVRIAALLHDIGKIHEVFAPILRKEGPLTSEEWAVMQTHPDKGAELISTLSDLRDIVAPIRHHHENWDGTGYPAGIAGETIPLASRVIAFADTMDALMTDRPYRKALGPDEVRAEFVKCRGTQFDPKLCDVVLSQAVWSQLFARATPTRSKVIAFTAAKRVS